MRRPRTGSARRSFRRQAWTAPSSARAIARRRRCARRHAAAAAVSRPSGKRRSGQHPASRRPHSDRREAVSHLPAADLLRRSRRDRARREIPGVRVLTAGRPRSRRQFECVLFRRPDLLFGRRGSRRLPDRPRPGAGRARRADRVRRAGADRPDPTPRRMGFPGRFHPPALRVPQRGRGAMSEIGDQVSDRVLHRMTVEANDGFLLQFAQAIERLSIAADR